MSSSFDPHRLDVEAFAQQQALLSGHASLADYPRLASEARPSPEQPEATADERAEVTWQARGERRRGADGVTYPALHLQADVRLALTCQRCLGAVQVPLRVDRHFLFAADEAAAAALDEACDDDVLALAHDYDLHALIEDELLMALPLVPRHAECPEAVRLSAQDAGFEAALAEKTQPFAALAALKGRKAH
ncbi:MAG TPA: DUF177 domain-containing protein [Ottowia sp.]|uniref:YceD family protein n=1 Tax=Ottowia sp. TaxID=1898956 RepID=UPI002B67A24D|nr:DUF177 domain-containing protein [Ottowia sp.]HMN20456.1 DUF177 domain-containing protein [Ottowia sp.]